MNWMSRKYFDNFGWFMWILVEFIGFSWYIAFHVVFRHFLELYASECHDSCMVGFLVPFQSFRNIACYFWWLVHVVFYLNLSLVFFYRTLFRYAELGSACRNLLWIHSRTWFRSTKLDLVCRNLGLDTIQTFYSVDRIRFDLPNLSLGHFPSLFLRGFN